jgi:DNA-binding MarR family transcriptional regulator
MMLVRNLRGSMAGHYAGSSGPKPQRTAFAFPPGYGGFREMMPGSAARGGRRARAVNLGDMSRNGKAGPAPAGGWLDGDQQRAWLAYIRIQLRLAYEMNRQLLADSGMSLPDYDVLTALSVADGGRMQITVLAAQIGWERSRVSHHVRRMSARGLVTCGLSAADRRVTEVTLTDQGRQALEEAAPGHVDLVRRLFFGGLPADLVGPLSEALESVYANIIKQGTLPPPVDWHPPED